MAPVICFLSDYGLSDGFVGVCHAVILRACPTAGIVDLTHGIAPQDVAGGARVLARAIRFLPDDAVVLADVAAGATPLVAIAAVDGRRLVGPDNGLLSAVLAECGGPAEVIEVADSPVALRPISETFPGRDVLAPVAAALAAGTPLARLGVPLDPDALTPFASSRAGLIDGVLHAHVVSVDRFGNVELDARAAQLEAVGLAVGDRVRVAGRDAVWARRFGDVADGGLLLYEDPQRLLAVAVSRGSAAERLGVGPGSELRITGA